MTFDVCQHTHVRYSLTNLIANDGFSLKPRCKTIQWKVATDHSLIYWAFDAKSAPRISRKPFDLESPNFTGTSIPALSTTAPDMTSVSTSVRWQIAQTCKFWVIFGSRFLDNASTDSEKVYTVLETVKGFISSSATY